MTPDPLTPEGAAYNEWLARHLGYGFCPGAPSELAPSRLAPKPAAEKEPLNFAGPIFLAPNAEGYINAFPGSGSVYVRNNQQVAVEVTAKRLEFPSAPDPDREAREALSAAKQHPQWYGAGLTGRLAALRAHGFRHQSEMNNGHEPPAPPPAAGDVVREALEWAGTNPIRPGYTTVVSDGASTRIVANETLAQYVERGAAALAARGVTFGGKA